MKEQVKLLDKTRNMRVVPDLRLDRDFCFGFKADYIIDLVKTGMILGESDPDNKDVMRLLPPAVVVARAFELADLLFDGLEKRGYVHKVPMWDDMVAELERDTSAGPGFGHGKTHSTG